MWKHHVDDPKPQPLQRKAEAEDDVVRARHPQRAIRFEHAAGSSEPSHVELVVFFEAHRANRVTISATPSDALGSRRWMTMREEGFSEFVHDEEKDLFRFPDGRFAFSRRYVDMELLEDRGY
jgi:hypothetical protein